MHTNGEQCVPAPRLHMPHCARSFASPTTLRVIKRPEVGHMHQTLPAPRVLVADSSWQRTQRALICAPLPTVRRTKFTHALVLLNTTPGR